MEELFPLVDEQGSTIGSAPRSECHSGCKCLHPVVHLHVFNTKGEILLQKRAKNKDIQPDKWDTSVGGHVSYGESIEEALQREAKEELGISSFSPLFLRKYIFESDIEKELVYTFKTIYEGPFQIEEKEISEIRFWSFDEIQKQIGKDIFTPNFEGEFNFLSFNKEIKPLE